MFDSCLIGGLPFKFYINSLNISVENLTEISVNSPTFYSCLIGD